MTYEALQEMGLEERTAEAQEVMGLMMRAERDLSTARLLQDKDEEWSFAAAYQAMARSGRALILSEGYRPKGSRSRDTHKTVVTASGVILGEKHKSLINKFDRMRRKYQNFAVETGSMVSRYEAGQAIRDAEEFFSLVAARLKEKYSQMSLLNDIPQLVSR
ncbi:MAG: HEPN domain-containing protein [Nitrospirota bacterium]